jgi:hypothetical protein
VTKSISPLDSDPYARALAASTRDKNRALGETRIAAHGLPRVNTADPATMNRIYAILDKRPRCLHPLSETFTWRDLAAAKLAASQMCDPRISGDCEKRCATEIFAIKRGELVCVYKACRPCVEFFDAPGRFRECAREDSHNMTLVIRCECCAKAGCSVAMASRSFRVSRRHDDGFAPDI